MSWTSEALRDAIREAAAEGIPAEDLHDLVDQAYADLSAIEREADQDN